MAENRRFAGVLVPVATPFTPDLQPDPDRFVEHCRWLLSRGADGLAVFGTTSEANSLSVDERMQLLDTLITEGIDPQLLLPGTGCCALTNTVLLTRHAMRKGCGGVLVLPPFFYKGVSDEGIFANIAEVIERVGDERLRIYLYHFPGMAVVGYSLEVIERLITAYPSVVVGIKDSSGDWAHTQAILQRFPQLDVFPGSEAFLLSALRAGGAGCITATANVNASMIRKLYDQWQTPQADTVQAEVTAVRKTIEAYPLIPAVKWILAHYRNDPQWATLRPPLMALTGSQGQDLIEHLKQSGFEFAV